MSPKSRGGLGLDQGVDVRVISERAGHLGSKITREYAAVATEVSRQPAEKAVSMIPRRSAMSAPVRMDSLRTPKRPPEGSIRKTADP